MARPCTLPLALLLVGCGSSRTTHDSGDPSPGDPSLFDQRYCEVLAVFQEGDRFRAEVYNTTGLNDCPLLEWDALDTEAIRVQLDAMVVLLNGPRHWVLDAIPQAGGVAAGTEVFGSIEMRRVATLDLGAQLPTNQASYVPRSVVRDTVFFFDVGRTVHELIDPEGTVWIMQSYSHQVDVTLTPERLPGLPLALPDDWSFATRTLDSGFRVQDIAGVATVVQDDFLNTYQQVP